MIRNEKLEAEDTAKVIPLEYLRQDNTAQEIPIPWVPSPLHTHCPQNLDSITATMKP